MDRDIKTNIGFHVSPQLKNMLEEYRAKMTQHIGIPLNRTIPLNYSPFDQEALRKRKRELEWEEDVKKFREHFEKNYVPKVIIKTDKMNKRTKKFYHTFDFKGREITLRLHVQEIFGDSALIRVTHAVRLHEDKEIEGLTKKILEGRFQKNKIIKSFALNSDMAFELPTLKGLGMTLENKIKRGELVIAGMQSAIEKEG